MTHEKYLAKIQELEAEIASLTAQLIVAKQSKATEIHTHYHYPSRPISTRPAWSPPY